MTKFNFTFITLTLISLSAFGQEPQGSFIADKRTGCKVWNPYYSTEDSIIWIGKCKNKFAEGFDQNKVVVYPNPATDFITIEGVNEISTISIHTILGVKVLEKTVTTNTQIPLDLASGIYLVKIQSEKKSEVIKIILR